MAKRLPTALPPLMRRFLMALAMLVFFSAATVYLVDAYPVLAARLGVLDLARRIGLVDTAVCAQNCQGCYCEDIINGQCIVDGQPKACVGCVGTCTGDYQCRCRAGVGGCGRYVVWCRNSDCRPRPKPTDTPTPPPTPTPVPTPTPTPPACQVGATWVEVTRPRTTQVVWDPPYPVLESQRMVSDPDPGVVFETWAQGGRAVRYETVLEQQCIAGGSYPADCPNSWRWACYDRVVEQYDDPIVSLEIYLPLSPTSSTWIQGDLAQRYYNAYPREGWEEWFLPHHAWHGRSMSVYTVSEPWLPDDPGFYLGRWRITTQGTPLNPPQSVDDYYQVPVYLRDVTLGE